MGRKPIPDEGRAFLRRLGTAIRDERREQRLHQGQLGARCEIEGSRIGEMERGRVNPSVLRVAAVAGALGIPLSQLIRRVERAAGDGDATALQRARIAGALRRLSARDLDTLARFVRLMTPRE